MSRPRVAVVGGGLAGIAAALEAADRGAEVVILERRRRLGGLTWSFRRKGLWLDNGQHVFLRCCTAYLGFLDRIGARDLVVLQDRLTIPVLRPGAAPSSITRDTLPAPLHLARSLASYRHLPVTARLRLARPALALRRLDPEDPALDEQTFGAWLRDRGQSPEAIARLWDLIVLPTLNVTADEASLALAVKVFRTGLLERADAGDIGWSTVPLGQLHGDRAEQALDEAGVEVALDATVEDLRRGAAGRWSVSAGERVLAADAVIVATPPDTAARLVPDGTLPDLEGLGTSPIVNVHLVFDRRITDLPMAAAVGSPVQFVFDRTASAGLERGQYLAVSISGADAYVGQRPEQLVRTFAEALTTLFPAARHAHLLDGTVSREHAATFRPRPGTAALRPWARTGTEGLFVAGAWCQTGWPATMEGAVRSGVAAATEALSAPYPSDHLTAQPLQEAPA